MEIQVESLRRDLLNGISSEQRRVVNRSLVPTLYPMPGFLVEGGGTLPVSSLSLFPIPLSSVSFILSDLH